MGLLFLGIVAWRQDGLGIELGTYVEAQGEKSRLFFVGGHVAASIAHRGASSKLCSWLFLFFHTEQGCIFLTRGMGKEKKRTRCSCTTLWIKQFPMGVQPERSYILFLVAHSKAFPPCSVNKCLLVFLVLELNLGLCVYARPGIYH